MEPQLFRVTQNAIVENRDGSVLIVRHAESGKWLLPGGKINLGENGPEGLKRELDEEVGLTQFSLKSILDADSWLEETGGCFVITYVVAAEPFTVRLSEEHSEYAWIRSQDVDAHEFWHSKISARILKHFESRQRPRL